MTRRVLLESPYAGNVTLNVIYARRCLRDSLNRGEAPMAPHLLYTQALRDSTPSEREIGLAAAAAYLDVADAQVVYTDHGISGGMARLIGMAEGKGVPVEYRQIGPVRIKRNVREESFGEATRSMANDVTGLLGFRPF